MLRFLLGNKGWYLIYHFICRAKCFSYFDSKRARTLNGESPSVGQLCGAFHPG